MLVCGPSWIVVFIIFFVEYKYEKFYVIFLHNIKKLGGDHARIVLYVTGNIFACVVESGIYSHVRFIPMYDVSAPYIKVYRKCTPYIEVWLDRL